MKKVCVRIYSFSLERLIFTETFYVILICIRTLFLIFTLLGLSLIKIIKLPV